MTVSPFAGWLAISEVAERAGVSHQTVWRRIKRGEFDTETVAGIVLVRDASVDYVGLRAAGRLQSRQHSLGGRVVEKGTRTGVASFAANPAELAWLDERCREHGMSRSNLIRSALNATYGSED